MKNKKNKRNKIMLKKCFTKDELLIMKKYPRLLWLTYEYKIPYAVINRAYNRYLRTVDDYVLLKGYPNWWFRKDKVTFCNAVKIYVCAKENKLVYSFGTHGFTKIEIVELSGLDKFISL